MPPLYTFELVWSLIDMGGDCWEWKGPHNGLGYGRIRLNSGKKKVYLHRAIYETICGPLKPGEVVMHKCDNPRCIRPSHLTAGTQQENMADMRSKGRWRLGRSPNKEKTTCPHGHEYTAENTHINRLGHRKCRACHRMKERERQERLRRIA